ncbi:MAG: Smr/MutS family protein [Holosporales bacterium]|jgi:hypothetical protein|nr:Smr/MutS family protein [Holosporales bacterium]
MFGKVTILCAALHTLTQLDASAFHGVKRKVATFDVHNCTREDMAEFFPTMVANALNSNCARINVITGRGVHSVGGKPVLRDDVINLAKQFGFYANTMGSNKGIVSIHLCKITPASKQPLVIILAKNSHRTADDVSVADVSVADVSVDDVSVADVSADDVSVADASADDVSADDSSDFK